MDEATVAGEEQEYHASAAHVALAKPLESDVKNFAAAALLCAVSFVTPVQAAIPVYSYVVKNAYPHDPEAFTQGLFFRDGHLYESTGMHGRSSIRKVELATGKVLRKHELSREFFGEGIAEVNGDIVGLTWTSQVGMVYDAKTFKEKKRFSYMGEGWGLASGGSSVYMSDGTSYIRVLNSALQEVRRFEVTADGTPINQLNELEWVNGELYANVWGTDVIARIDPATGKVVGWIVLKNLLKPQGTPAADAVLNGIAYDPKGKRLFVTGKLWPQLFEIELVEVRQAARK